MVCTLTSRYRESFLEILRYLRENPLPSPYSAGDPPALVFEESIPPGTGIGAILEEPKVAELGGREYRITLVAAAEVLPDGNLRVFPQKNYFDLGPAPERGAQER
ncbi:MAG: hypothetical protein V1820_00600 [archaeon]